MSRITPVDTGFHGTWIFKQLALAGMVGASVIFGAREAKGVPIPWSSLSDIFYDASIYPDGASADYAANSITFKDQNGNVIANSPNFSLVYIVNYPNGSSAIAGGLDGSGNSASGWFNKEGPYDTGLNIGQTNSVLSLVRCSIPRRVCDGKRRIAEESA